MAGDVEAIVSGHFEELVNGQPTSMNSSLGAEEKLRRSEALTVVTTGIQTLMETQRVVRHIGGFASTYEAIPFGPFQVSPWETRERDVFVVPKAEFFDRAGKLSHFTLRVVVPTGSYREPDDPKLMVGATYLGVREVSSYHLSDEDRPSLVRLESFRPLLNDALSHIEAGVPSAS
ncbi:MAG TPA: hypothetical protein VIH90_04570 [Candidatus Saccharimonadales bacterium]